MLYHPEEYTRLRQPPEDRISEQLPFQASLLMTFNASELLRTLTDNPTDETAWVTSTRLFVKGTLTNSSQGGKRGARKANKLQQDFSKYRWKESYRRKERQRTAKSRKPDMIVHGNQDKEDEGLRKQINISAQKLLKEGRISQGLRRMEAAPMAPANEATFKAMKALHPASRQRQNDPEGWERRLQVCKNRIYGPKGENTLILDPDSFATAAKTLPISSATWMQPGHIRAMAKSRGGVRLLRQVCQLIINGQVPERIKPLLFDWKLIGLIKGSHHQQSIDDLLAMHRDAEDEENTTPPKSDQ